MTPIVANFRVIYRLVQVYHVRGPADHVKAKVPNRSVTRRFQLGPTTFMMYVLRLVTTYGKVLEQRSEENSLGFKIRCGPGMQPSGPENVLRRS